MNEDTKGKIIAALNMADKAQLAAKNAANKLKAFKDDWAGQAAMALVGGAVYGWASSKTVKEWSAFTLHGGHLVAIGGALLTRDGKGLSYRPLAHGAIGAMGAETYQRFAAMLGTIGS